MDKKQWKRHRIPLGMLALGIVLMVSGKRILPEDKAAPATGTTTTTATAQAETNIQLEQEIETLLCAISGVKEATVVITYEDSGKQEVEKDETAQTEETKEEDGAGGNRTVEAEQKTETTIYVEDAEGNRYPFVKTETYATVRGVAVVVKGTYEESIREKIVRTLEVLLDVPTHKIQVIW